METALKLLFVVCLLSACNLTDTASDDSTDDVDGDVGTVVRVIDGDTIEVEIDGIVYDVRYVGVNTPERDEVCYDEATEANRDFVQGREVRLERDESDTDRFDRLLRYVYANGTFVNEELVRQGFAEAVLYQPDDREFETFRELEEEAAAAGRGCHPTGIFDDGTDVR